MKSKQSVTKKITPRLKRKLRIKNRIAGRTDRARLVVYKSSKYTSAQVVSSEGKTLVSASSMEQEVKDRIKAFQQSEDNKISASGVNSPKSVSGAFVVGEVIAERAKEKGIAQVVFDRNGFLYHGRIKAAADGARAKGLEF